ncbi:MAG: hypothetical protein QHH10_09970 [Peptococcaceae bacterium]|jgi:hypothetical protein|nr:hypothetical protein [Peptococcaceae bacterium]MDH7525627.1 hypothetical protein [Peptococcaceae bacterium]
MSSKNDKAKGEKKPGLAGIMASLIALAAAGLIYFGDRGTRHLVLPLLVFLALTLVSKTIAFVFRGSFVETLCGSLRWLAAGVAVYLLFINDQAGQGLRLAGIYVLSLTAVLVFYRVLAHFTSGRPCLQAVLKSLVLLVSAFLARNLIMAASGILKVTGAITAALANLVLGGMVFAAVCALFSPAALSTNYYIALAGKWIGTRLPAKFFAFLLLAAYVSIARPHLEGNVYLATVEWVVLVLLCLVLFRRAVKSIDSLTQQTPPQEWKKHRLVVEQDAGRELPEIASCINDFIERSDKRNILIAVVEEGLKRGLAFEQIGAVIDDFLKYSDQPAPLMATKWRERQVEKDNRKNRESVLAAMIDKLKRS